MSAAARTAPARSQAGVHPPALLVYLDAVARAGAIRKAAESPPVASTALNRRILNLEEELGTPLFERQIEQLRGQPAFRGSPAHRARAGVSGKRHHPARKTALPALAAAS